MSAQTIIPNTYRSIFKKTDEFYICQGNKYIANEDYNLGNGVDMKKFMIVKWMDDILSNSVCYKFDKEILLKTLNSILIK